MADPEVEGGEEGGNKGRERRRIPGNLPYTTSPGALKRVLERLPTTEKPSVFNIDFMSTVLQVSGGSARPIPPILKATGLLNGSGVPTELYSQFQTDTGRSAAALQALRNGFAEIFRRNQYAHKADEKSLVDSIVAITGLPKTEAIVRSILTTFQAFQEYAKGAREAEQPAAENTERIQAQTISETRSNSASNGSLGLVYNINVVLPETTNVEVYNAIFRSLRGNMLS